MKTILRLRFFSFIAIILFAVNLNAIGQPIVSVIQPNEPGISWVIGNTYLISWTSTFTLGTKIDLLDYTIPGPPVVTPIVASAVGSTYSWTITPGTFTAGTHYKIKVSSAACGDCYMDESNNYFSLVNSAPGTYIHVEQPNIAGIIWQKGSTYQISWSDNVSGTVKIELWKGGILHSTLATGVVGSTYLWTILNDGSILSGTNYKIKVISTVDAGISDESDVNFEIAAAGSGTITVIQPSLPAITWVRGNSYLISWSDNLSGTVDIKLFKGGIETATIATNVVGSCYVWPIDILTAIGNDYKIRVISHDDAGTLDESDNNFSIQSSAVGTSITVQQPNTTGITWLKGSTYLISWIDNVPGTVKVSLYKGGVVHSVLALNVVGTTYLWTIPNDGSVISGIDYTIRVSSTDDGSIEDFSDNNFSIAVSGFGTITVLQPNVTGITWVRGYSYLISWIDNVTGTVDIKLFKGGVDVLTIATNVVGTTYVWNIPIGTTLGIDYKIKVISHDDASTADLSDADFSIQATPAGGTITVLQPNGGEYWYIGNSYLISWDDNFPESVNIDLYESDGVTLKYSIATNVVGSTYVWNTTGHIPALGGDYKVKITSTLEATLTDMSNAVFHLICLPLISVYPNPADYFVTVKFDESSTDNFTLSLTDRFNMQVMTKTVNSEGMKELRISTVDLPNGVYFLTIASDKSIETKKILIQH
jgi:hypothetical protein